MFHTGRKRNGNIHILMVYWPNKSGFIRILQIRNTDMFNDSFMVIMKQ